MDEGRSLVALLMHEKDEKVLSGEARFVYLNCHLAMQATFYVLGNSQAAYTEELRYSQTTLHAHEARSRHTSA